MADPFAPSPDAISHALAHAQDALRLYGSMKYNALNALRALVAQKSVEERPAFYAWMRSQPFTLVGFTFPTELLDILEKED